MCFFFFFCFYFPSVRRLLSGFDEFSAVRSNAAVWVSTAREKGHKCGAFFWQNRFHGCFMLHRPLVFRLALASHNVNLKHAGFEVGVLIQTTHPQSACLHMHTQIAVTASIFPGP